MALGKKRRRTGAREVQCAPKAVRLVERAARRRRRRGTKAECAGHEHSGA